MILDSATVESNFQRFINRVIENETVFYLSNDEGVANSVSNDDEETIILMFWSDRAYAERANRILPEEFSESEMTLFEFLYRWLPGMTGDGVLSGPNWNGDLIGREIEPLDLRTKIEERMPPELLEEYEESYRELTERT
jgi:DNA polymerase III delta prime subunit